MNVKWRARLDRPSFSSRIAAGSGMAREFQGRFMGILAALIIGAIAGWLAGLIVHGAGFGLIGNMVVGIIGALVASFLLPQLHIELATGTVGSIVDATIGAVVVLVILSLVRRA